MAVETGTVEPAIQNHSLEKQVHGTVAGDGPSKPANRSWFPCTRKLVMLMVVGQTRLPFTSRAQAVEDARVRYERSKG